MGFRVTRLEAALAVAVLASLPPAATAAADMTELKVGISEPVNTVLALWMAEAGGFFAAHGLKVDIIGVSRNVDDYVDTGLLEGLKREGFFTALAQQCGKR